MSTETHRLIHTSSKELTSAELAFNTATEEHWTHQGPIDARCIACCRAVIVVLGRLQPTEQSPSPSRILVLRLLIGALLPVPFHLRSVLELGLTSTKSTQSVLVDSTGHDGTDYGWGLVCFGCCWTYRHLAGW